MKKRDLEKKLKQKNANKIREGEKHEVWESRKGKRFTVPRSREIKEGTAKSILKQADS